MKCSEWKILLNNAMNIVNFIITIYQRHYLRVSSFAALGIQPHITPMWNCVIGSHYSSKS